MPLTVSVLALTYSVGEAFNVTVPAPKFRGLLPTKVKLPFQLWAMPASVTLPAVLSTEPPLIVHRPEPRALIVVEDQVAVAEGRATRVAVGIGNRHRAPAGDRHSRSGVPGPAGSAMPKPPEALEYVAQVVVVERDRCRVHVAALDVDRGAARGRSSKVGESPSM